MPSASTKRPEIPTGTPKRSEEKIPNGRSNGLAVLEGTKPSWEGWSGGRWGVSAFSWPFWDGEWVQVTFWEEGLLQRDRWWPDLQLTWVDQVGSWIVSSPGFSRILEFFFGGKIRIPGFFGKAVKLYRKARVWLVLLLEAGCFVVVMGNCCMECNAALMTDGTRTVQGKSVVLLIFQRNSNAWRT